MKRAEILAAMDAAIKKAMADLKADGFFAVDFGDEYMGGPVDLDVDIPIPKHVAHARYPWRQMEIGNSFFVPGKTVKSIVGPMTFARRTLGHKYATRPWRQPSGVEGVRVWRVQ